MKRLSNYRIMRIGLLVAVIVGFLIWRLSMRAGRTRGFRNSKPPPNQTTEDYRDR